MKLTPTVPRSRRNSHLRRDLALVLAAGLAAVAASQGCSGAATTTTVSSPDSKPVAGLFTGPESVWNKDVSTAPLAADSPALVSSLASQVRNYWGGVAAFNYYQYNDAFYTVPATQTRRDVIWDNCQRKPSVDPVLYDPAKGAIFAQVPIPDDAIPAGGTDAELTIYSPSSDQLWEFWKARKAADGWHACWGGRIDNVSTARGYFPGYTGASASGLSASAGSIGINEMRQGTINHSLGLAIVDVAHASTFSYPAQRSDGNLPLGAPGAIMEGQRFRLDPSVNLDDYRLTPIARAVAVAAKKYGFIVVDRSGAVAVSAENGAGVKAIEGVDPWTALRAGVPGYSIMKNFPWHRLQALPVDWGKPAA